MHLAARALQTIRKHRMFPRGARVLVAVSGGADSVGLLQVLCELAARRQLTVAGVAHFNHQLRGAAADADEAFCRELAAALDLPFESGSADVAAAAARYKRSIEDTARTLRYQFLQAAAGRCAAEATAVGHTRDDQAETFLMRLLRGAGARGLGGIRPRSGQVVRPLIETSRAEVRAYVASRGLSFREDASNLDLGILRNRVRHRLLPELQQFSPRIVEILATSAAQAQRDEDYLERQAIVLADSIVLTNEGGALDATGLQNAPPALGCRVARLVLEKAANGRFVGSQHIEALLALAGAEGTAAVSLPGLTALRRGGQILLDAAEPRAFSNSSRLPLSIPGEVSLGGWQVSAALLADWNGKEGLISRGSSAVVAAGPLMGPLAVRSRRPGDRFKPLGMHGRGRKLQDFLVDRKIARGERDRLPLVVDREDRIVWVAGLSVAEDFRVTQPALGVILLKVRRLGGVG